jgi:formate-dependent phosphoribosylglycinamide formyltransferase (GAR transformylase)
MAANTVTAAGNTVAGTDPNFTINHKCANVKCGVAMYVVFDVNSSASLTLTFKVINPLCHATALFTCAEIKSADVTTGTLTYALGSADLNARLFIPMHYGETELQVVAVFGSGAGGGSATFYFVDL